MNPAERSLRTEMRDGWGLILVATVGTALTSMHFALVGVLMNALSQAYGWQRDEIALGIPLATAAGAIMHLPVGLWIDRFGARRVLLPSIPLFALGLAGLGLAGPMLWTWYAAYVFLGTVLVGASAFAWFAAIVRQFHVSRGLALAIPTAGSGLLTAFTPALALTLLEAFGLRGVFFAMATGTLVILLPGAWLLVRPPAGSGEAAHAHVDLARGERGALLRSLPFAMLALATVLISLTIGTFAVHFQPILTDDIGLSPETAAQLGLFMGPSFVIVVLGIGTLFDRFPPRLVMLGAFLLPAVVSAMLLVYEGGFLFGAIIALFVGGALGAPANVIAYASGRFFDARHYGLVSGILFGLLGVCVGIGSWIAGALFDAAGSYRPAYLLVIACSVVAAALTQAVRQTGAVRPVGAAV